MQKFVMPSRNFDGSDLGGDDSAAYLTPGLRRVLFNKTNNPEGVHLCFLPSYTVDPAGQGVWYKKFTIRGDFGDGFRETYYVEDIDSDPAEYFARNCKLLFPDLALKETKDVKGKQRTYEPKFGKLKNRVLFNVLPYRLLNQGAQGVHILELPARQGADRILKLQDGYDHQGRPLPMVCDPDNMMVVKVEKLKDTMDPWQIQVMKDTVRLPDELRDMSLFYQLDQLFVPKPQAEIIAKLREAFGGRVFDECMQGFPGLTIAPRRAVQESSPAVMPPAVQGAVPAMPSPLAPPAPAPVPPAPQAAQSLPAPLPPPPAAGAADDQIPGLPAPLPPQAPPAVQAPQPPAVPVAPGVPLPPQTAPMPPLPPVMTAAQAEAQLRS